LISSHLALSSSPQAGVAATHSVSTTMQRHRCWEDGILAFCVSWVPLWWLLGFDFFIYHFLALIILSFRPRVVQIRDHFQLVFLLLILVLLASLIANALLGGDEFIRVVASTNNLSILALGYVIYGYVRTMESASKTLHSGVLGKAGARVTYAYVLVAGALLIWMIFRGSFELRLPTLFGLLAPTLPGLLGEYQQVWLLRYEWFAGFQVPRLFIFAPFATASGLLVLLAGILAFPFVYARSRIEAFALLLLVGVAVVMTLTRASMGAYLLATMVIIGALLRRKWRSLLAYTLPVTVPLLAMLVVLVSGPIMELREGSTQTRLHHYALSVNHVLQSSPVYGVGVKPYTEDEYIPLGSHSSVLSVFVRGGFIGLVLFLIAFVVVPILWVLRICLAVVRNPWLSASDRSAAGAAIAGYVACFIYMMVGDIDAYPVVTVLVFSAIAFLKQCEVYVRCGIARACRRPPTGASG
jgi:hypothetical protein